MSNYQNICTDSPHNLEFCPECSDLAEELHSKISATVNVHTARFALSANSETSEFPTFQVTPLRTTGAGDSWNGGNILGILLNCDPRERLALANATAGFFVASPEGTRPSLLGLAEFIENHKDNLHAI